ncbi:multimerin-2-like [Haliotis rufescens]|uniref:multimerin-2-like n=1 Tax=Haliotis rufescens TaxID=6454 RepID=UPI00201EEB93|nr:multimerin-2-like [Haliotis rufescens]
MCELTWVSLLLALLMPLGASLIVPMSKPNGDADLISITSHVTLMEQTVNSLEARFQTTKTELTTVKADLKTTRTELSSLQLLHIDAVRDLTVTQTQLNNALAELHTVKDDLKKAESELALVKLQSLNLSELTNLKTELKTVRTELSAARSESNGTSSEQRSIKRELARLTSNVKAQHALINETVLDAISSDVKSNLAEIVLLKSELSLTRADTNKTACEVEIIQDYLNSSSVAVGDLEKELTSLIEIMDNATLEANTTQGEVSQLMKGLHDLGQSVEDHSNTLNNISFSIDRLETAVAFQASPSAYYFDVKDTEKLIFDSALYNLGDSYDGKTGLFTAPVHGTFIFWAGASSFGKNTRVTIRLNLNHNRHGYLAQGTGISNNNSTESTASVITTAQLRRGDVVWLEKYGGTDRLFGTQESYFGGVLLHHY